jgi:hypothetical protein
MSVNSTTSPGDINEETLGVENEINLVMGIIYFVLFAFGVPLFVFLRNKEPIKSRGWQPSLLQMTAVLLELALRVAGFQRITCVIDNWRTLFLIPLFLYPYFYRVFVLWYRFNLQNVLLLNLQHTKKGRIIIWTQLHPWVTSTTAQILFFVSLAITTTCLAMGLFYSYHDQVQPDCSFFPGFIINIIQGVTAVILLGVSAYVLWGVNDAYLLKFEFIILLCTGLPLFILWVVSTELNWLGVANPGFWVNLVEIFFFCATILLPVFGTRSFTRMLRRKYKMGSLSDPGSPAEDELNIILGDEVLVKSLELHMVQSWTIEILLFLKRVEEYQSVANDQRPSLAQKLQKEFVAEGKKKTKTLEQFHYLLTCLLTLFLQGLCVN